MAQFPRLLPLIAVAIGGVVAVRAVGAGPDLFAGAQAWAQEATPASAPGEVRKPIPPVCALTPEQLAQQAGVSVAELRIIQSLKARRLELDGRDTDLATALPLLMAAEQKLDAKIVALNAIKAEMQVLLGQVDEKEKAENDRLVAVYSAMRPREAAAIFTTLEDSVRLPIAAAMRPRGLSAIMAQMSPPAAKELTEKLARRYQSQQLAARAAAADAIRTAPAAATPAPTPVAAAATPAAPAPVPTETATAPTAAPPAARPPARAAARPPARRPTPTPSPAPRAAATPPPAAPIVEGPQPYRAPAGAAATSDAASAAPRQSVE